MPSANHRNLFVPGPAGKLEAIFWTPERPDSAVNHPPIAAVVCHPHPLFGGTMHNKVVYQVARTLDRLGLPTLRFNFRGTGASAGEHDKGRGEQEDVRAALDFLAGEFPGVALMVAGFSFGCWVGLRAGCADQRVTEMVGLGAPVNDSDMSYLGGCDKPCLLVQGERDPYGAPRKLEEVVAAFPEQSRQKTKMVIVPGADHFFTGLLDHVGTAITEWVVGRHPELAAK